MRKPSEIIDFIDMEMRFSFFHQLHIDSRFSCPRTIAFLHFSIPLIIIPCINSGHSGLGWSLGNQICGNMYQEANSKKTVHRTSWWSGHCWVPMSDPCLCSPETQAQSNCGPSLSRRTVSWKLLYIIRAENYIKEGMHRKTFRTQGWPEKTPILKLLPFWYF